MNSLMLERPVPGSTVRSLMPVEPRPRAAWGMRYPVRNTAPYWARFHGKWFLDRCQDVSGDVADSAVLIVSELVTNAYIAARDLPDPAAVDLSLRLFADHLLIEVIDSSPGTPVLNVSADGCVESGRGLQLVNSLGDEWGYFFHEDRKVVYCILQVPAPERQESKTKV